MRRTTEAIATAVKAIHENEAKNSYKVSKYALGGEQWRDRSRL